MSTAQSNTLLVPKKQCSNPPTTNARNMNSPTIVWTIGEMILINMFLLMTHEGFQDVLQYGFLLLGYNQKCLLHHAF